MFESREVAAAVDAVRCALDHLATLPRTALDAARTSTLLTAAADLEDAQTVVALVQARVLASLDVVAPVTWRPGPFDPAPPVPDVDQTTAHEIAATLGSSVAMVRDRLATARVLRDVPGVVGAAAAGALRWWQVRRVAEAVVGLTPDARAEVDRRIAADARAGRCRNRFGARLGRAVLAADPGHADRAHREGVADRRVTVRPADAGMAWFGACLPAEDALTVARCLDDLAAEPDGAGLGRALTQPPAAQTGPAADPATTGTGARTADQRRADALTGLARAALEALHDCAGGPGGVTDDGLRDRFTHHLAAFVGSRSSTAPDAPGHTGAAGHPDAPGHPDAAGHTGAAEASATAPTGPTRDGPGTASAPLRRNPRRAARRRAEVQLVVSAETVLGIADHPGDLVGYGPVGPEQARRIAHLAGATWRRLITDPVTGVVLDRGRGTYTPPAALADHVRARFGWTCTRPGCSNAAADLDHATAWAESGATSLDNLHPVCRGCHTAKHAGWTVRIDPDGTTTWRTPHGRSCSTRPTDHRPEDRVPRPPRDLTANRPGDHTADRPVDRTADRPGNHTADRPVDRTADRRGDDDPSRAVDASDRPAPTGAGTWWTEVSRDVAAARPAARTEPLPAPF